MGLTKKEAWANPGSYLSSFFVYTPPRFYFNRSEQLLLHHALMGETSDELAVSLSISPWTVKKRWRAIYGRVGDVDRELLLPPVANGADATARVRNAEGTCFIICDSTSKNFVPGTDSASRRR